ncbi:MAG: nitroreductase family protein [Actinobacteria bacterium]|nr:nitroreductase family protein [Actinomycetota bacterium]
MELLDAIRQRRSIRVFDGRPVDPALIDRLVEAATYAPSRWNIQPWHFHIATNDARRRVAETMAMNTQYVEEALASMGPEMVEYAARFYADLGRAPVVIGISSPLADDRYDAMDDAVSVGAALENFLLAATSLGLATCSLSAPAWVRSQLAQVFEIPEGSELRSMIVVGYADEVPREKDRHTDVATYLK